MNERFLDFWGKYFLDLMQAGLKPGEKFPDEMFSFWHEFMKDPQAAQRLFASPAAVFDKQLDFFRKCCGLKEDSELSDYFKALKGAADEFRKSAKEFLPLFDAVPREEYDELKKKYGELQENFEAREETIRQLRMKLLVKGVEEMGAASGIQEMIKTQTEQFTALMDALGGVYGRSAAAKPKTGEKPKTEKKEKK
jgi:hypothetical protein